MDGFIKLKNGNTKVEIDNSGWSKLWFDSGYYRKLYGHRDEREAADFVDVLADKLNIRPTARVLDLGCGHGRHSRQLASRGCQVIGLDLSSSSIREAKKSESNRMHFYKHDMRVPFGKDFFDYVFNFFTSFGYFKTAHENFQVVNNISDSLKQEGMLVLDYLNIHYAESRMIPHEMKEIDGIPYRIERWSDEYFFYKKISIEDAGESKPLEFVEQVAKLGIYDFEYMLSRYKLKMEKIYGDYDLNKFDRDCSPRLIIQAKKQ